MINSQAGIFKILNCQAENIKNNNTEYISKSLNTFFKDLNLSPLNVCKITGPKW